MIKYLSQIYMECSKKRPLVSNFKLRKHQTNVVNHFLDSEYRGMIFYHGLGAGKTVTSLSFALDYLKSVPNPSEYRIWIITPGSIRWNFVSEYCKFFGMTKYSSQFSFLSYNYSKLFKYIDNYNFDNSIIIVDEFHNLINGARNASKNYVELYKKILYAKNSKVLLLSGTPLIYYPYEISLTYNLVKENAFPIDPREFKKICRIQDDRLIIPKKRQFKEVLSGVLSYVPNLGKEFYPEVINMPDTKVKITSYQLPYYMRRRLKEIRIAFPEGSKTEVNILSDYKKKSMSPAKFLAFSMLLSRQVANFCYPPEYQENLISSKSTERADVPDDKELIIDLKKLKTKYSPKFYFILKRIQQLEGKHLVYTQFLNRHGVKLLQQLLLLAGIQSLSYTGNLGNDEERSRVLTTFNASNNINGQKFKVMLTTSAGTQGLTMLDTNYVHILEPHRSEMFIHQLIGRAVRYRSHDRIKNIRNFVRVYRYYAILPDTDFDRLTIGEMKFDEKDSADIMIKRKADKSFKAMQPLLKMMKETSIDCEENFEEGKCFKSKNK